MSFVQAMDGDSQYQETHFPYSPTEGEGSTSLLCDKPENRLGLKVNNSGGGDFYVLGYFADVLVGFN